MRVRALRVYICCKAPRMQRKFLKSSWFLASRSISVATVALTASSSSFSAWFSSLLRRSSSWLTIKSHDAAHNFFRISSSCACRVVTADDSSSRADEQGRTLFDEDMLRKRNDRWKGRTARARFVPTNTRACNLRCFPVAPSHPLLLVRLFFKKKHPAYVIPEQVSREHAEYLFLKKNASLPFPVVASSLVVLSWQTTKTLLSKTKFKRSFFLSSIQKRNTFIQLLPRMRRASCMSLGMIVTRPAWMAHMFVSSNRPTRNASLASCSANIAVD